MMGHRTTILEGTLTHFAEIVSEFWGRDMYVGANILLPHGYNSNSSKRQVRPGTTGFVLPQACSLNFDKLPHEG